MGKHGVVEHKSVLVGKLLELTLPVDFERGRTNDQAGVSVGTIHDTDALERLAKPRLVTDEETMPAQPGKNALLLVVVGFDTEVMLECFSHTH